MKKSIYKFISFLLAAYIITFNVFSCSIVAYAYSFDPDEHPFLKKAQDFLEDFSTVIVYIASSVGAIVDGNFANYVSGLDAWHDYWNKDHITVDEKNEKITFSDDLVKFIKQALKEYAEETNGFMIIPSMHFSTISTSSFGSSYQYNTVKSLINEYGLVGLTYDAGYVYVYGFSEYLNNNAGFYVLNEYSNWYYLCLENFLTWSQVSYPDNYLCMGRYYEKVIHNWDEAKSSASPSDGLYYYSASDERNSYGNLVIYKPGYAVFNSGSAVKLVSKDGRNILVFKNKAALENYSVEHRTVYFGSKFYEDTGSVTGDWDDFQKWLDGEFDDIWDRLKDLIPEGSTISEDDLEKLIDKLLDQLKEVVNKVEEGNKETNNLLQQILNALNNLDNTMSSALSGISFDTSVIENYLDRILGDLDHISAKLDEITYEEAEEKTDSFLSSLTSAFSEIVNVGKTKFPLSLPWDVYNILNIFSGGSESVAAYENFSMEYSADEGIMLFSEDGNRIDADDVLSALDFSDSSPPVSLYGHEETPDNPIRPPGFNSKAPRFEIPFKIVSWGVDETLVIDLYKFEVISQLSRTLLTAYFVFGLIKLTFTVVGFGNEVFK